VPSPPDVPCYRFLENLLVATARSCYFRRCREWKPLNLLFGFCAACVLSYRCLQMEWWAVVTVIVIPSQPVLLIWPCVSAARPSVLSPRASRAILHSRHPADCILPILVRKLVVGVFPATAIPNRLLRFHGFFLSLKYFPSIKFPASCLSMKSAAHVP